MGMERPMIERKPHPPVRRDRIKLGLLHASLAARAKWPEFLLDGRQIDWVALDILPQDHSGFDGWVIGTRGTKAARIQTLRMVTSMKAGLGPVMVLLHPMDEHDDWLAFKADAYHESSSSAALLAQRLENLVPSQTMGKDNPLPIGHSLASAEAEFWRSLFNSAGAGLISGRASSFFRSQENIRSLGPATDRQSALGRIRQLLRSVQWELNNHRAKSLLGLTEPVSLESEFFNRFTPVHITTFLQQLLTLSPENPDFSCEVLVRDHIGQSKYLSIELTLPNEISDSLLMTLLDISDRFQLEQDLRTHVQNLETRVNQRTLEIRQMNAVLERDNRQRKKLNAQVQANFVAITKSIIQSKQILELALPGKEALRNLFPQSVFISRPLNIIGGDFLFLDQTGAQKTLSLIDSTGHGITGAMISLTGSMLMRSAYTSQQHAGPAAVLNQFLANCQTNQRSDSSGPQVHGFDAAVITLDAEKKTVQFAGAKGNLFLIRDGQAILYRGTRMSIYAENNGTPAGTASPQFDQDEIALMSGDQLYLYSDGITDQFGGPKNKKLGRRRLGEILRTASTVPIADRQKAIQNELLIWKGSHFKVDDATLVGFEF